MSRKRRWWTRDEIAIVRAQYPHVQTAQLAAQLGRSLQSTYQVANKIGLRKTAEYLASPEACRLRRGDHPGVATQFKKGQVPLNKGLRRPGWAPGRMAETQFKKGERRGRANLVHKPIGTERLSKDGYLERKINEDLPFQGRWRAVHLLMWEEANGPLPRGFAVRFKNGDRTDIRLDNLELISRADLARRNSIHNLPPELKGAITALGAVKRKIRRMSEKQDRRSA